MSQLLFALALVTVCLLAGCPQPNDPKPEPAISIH